MIVVGSFAMGSCVHQDETIQGVLRRNGYPTISTGIGASGAFAALGVLKEYGEYSSCRSCCGNSVIPTTSSSSRSASGVADR
jgi:hypothetical protein